MSENKYIYTTKELPYEYNALEPYMDTQTMIIHHDNHLATYVNNLNIALEPYPMIQGMDLVEILRQPALLPNTGKTQIMRNAGGVFNHNFFFRTLRPGRLNNEAIGNLSLKIEREFDSFERFKEIFTQEALKVFGSGYLWLVMDSKCKISIISTANQDTPLGMRYYPLITIDLWEHAYYLNNQNRRNEYVHAWWHVINWDVANKNATCS